MKSIPRVIIGLLVAVSLLAPLSAYAVGVPFGGVILAEVPCHIGPTPALWLNVLGFPLIVTAGTIPFAYFAPIIGRFILGMADIPITCSVGTVPLPPGLRIQFFGVSLNP